MALIGNRSVTHKSPMRQLGGVGNAGDRNNFSKPGMLRSARLTFGKLAAWPAGYGATGWFMPVSAGEMSSANAARVAVGASGLAVGGVTTTGEAGFAITIPDVTASLIAGGAGSASFSITSNAPLLTASVNGAGTASWSITTNSPLLGAIADGAGSASFAIGTNTPTMYPINDASPLRTGSAMMTFTGTLIPYAVGHMQGSTVDNSVLTADTIKDAVWSAPLAGYTTTGTAGKALASASSGGVDYAALGMAVWQYATRTLTSAAPPTESEIAAAVWGQILEAGLSAEQIIRILAAQAAGDAQNLEGANPQFTGLDGTTVRIAADYDAGTRTITSLNGD